MKITNQALVDKFINTIKGISKKDKIAIFHDTDPDGITSGVLIKKACEKLGLDVVFVNWLDRSDDSIDNNTIKILKQKGVNYVFFCDLTIYQIPGRIENYEKLGKIIIFDHHPWEKDMNSDNVVFLLPNFFQEGIVNTRYCTAKLVYDFFSHLVNLSEYDWICAVGVIADFAFDAWPEYLDMCFQKYNDERKPNLFDTKLGKIAKLLSYGSSIGRDYINDGFKAVYNSKEPDDVLSKIPEEFKNVEQDILTIVGHYKNDAEIDSENEFIFYKINSKYGISSQVSSIISQKYEPKTLVIVCQQRENDSSVHISARRQDWKIDCGKLMRESSEDIKDANGGGHIPAAGAGIPAKDFEKFKKKLFENVKSKKYLRNVIVG